MLAPYILRMADAGERIAFVEQGVYRSRFYSYAQVEERAVAFCHWLREQGMGATGDGEPARVIIWASPGARWAMAFYGSLLAGAVVVPVDANFSPDFIARVARHTNASLLVTDPASVSRRSPPQEIPQLLTPDLETLPPAHDVRSCLSHPTRDSLAEIVYTSGTTAEPRGVMITHGNLLANLEPVEREIRRFRLLAVPFRPLRFLHLIPLSHLFGQVMGLFIPQLLQGVVIFPESQATGELARVIRERRVSVMVCVPQQLGALGNWALAQHLKSSTEGIDFAADVRLSVPARWWKFRHLHRALGWKMWAFVVGGAALPSRVETLWNVLGYAVVQGYGLTETAPAISITHPFKIRRGSVGRLLAGAEVRIAADGEILVRGPNVSPGYYKNAAATGESFSDGWLHTGDLGRFDEEGNLVYLGRKKEVIVTAEGLNVHPEDVEQALVSQPGVYEAAVVGREISAPAGRTLVHAVLVPATGAGSAAMEDAVSKANQRLEPHQRIRGYSIWPQSKLPRTISTQKLQRSIMAAWVNRNTLTGATSHSPGAPPEAVSTSIMVGGTRNLGGDWRNFLVGLGVPPERLRPEARLNEDLGLSSLDRVELLTWLETHGHDVDAERFTQALTIREIEGAITAEAHPVAGLHGPPAEAVAESWGAATEVSRPASPLVAATRRDQPHDEFAIFDPRYPSWPRWKLVSVLRELGQTLIIFPLLRYFVRCQVDGKEKLEKLSPPFLFVANHQSHFDVPVILRALPHRFRRRLAPAMGENAFRNFAWVEPTTEQTADAGRLARSASRQPEPPLQISPPALLFWARFLFNGYLLPDDSGGVQGALRHAGRLAEEGHSTLIFPEGVRTPDGSLQRFRPGVGVMAERLGLPVVPLLIQGLYESWPRTAASPVARGTGRARLRIGDPLFIQPGETAAQFTSRLENYYRKWA